MLMRSLLMRAESARVAKLRELGRAAHAVYFGSKADNMGGLVRCANKRSEVWCACAEWLKAGAIVNDAELKAQLVGPEFSENAQGIILERKEDMRARGLSSQDIADALALTFSVPVFTRRSLGTPSHGVISEWEPLSDASLRGQYGDAATGIGRSPRYFALGWPGLKPESEW
jgi:hypothetical protein